MKKSIISEGKIIVILIFLFIISLILIKLLENTNSFLIDTSFVFLIITMIMLPINLSFYLTKSDNNSKQKTWNKIPFVWLIISIFISIIIQQYLTMFNPFHAWQLSLDMFWPYLSIIYILLVLIINTIANRTIKKSN